MPATSAPAPATGTTSADPADALRHSHDGDRGDRDAGRERGDDDRRELERDHPDRLAPRPAEQADRRQLVAALGGRHRGGVDQRERGEQHRQPDHHPHAPGAAHAERAHVAEVLGARLDPHAGMGRGVAVERAPAAGHEDRALDAGSVRPGERRIEHDVAEARRAVVDRGDAERHRGRVLEPRADGVADHQVTLGRDDAADGDAGALHVADVPGADAQVGGAVRAAQPGGRPRGVPARQALAEQEHLRGPHARGGVDAREPGELRRRAGGQRRAVAAGDDVRRLDPRGGHRLRVVAAARREHALAADQHRDQQDRRRQRGAAPAVRGQAGARQQAGRAEQPQRPRQQRGRQAEQPAPEQRGPGREQDRREDRERVRLLAVEQQRHRGAAAERQQAGERAHDAGTAVLDRHLAQRLGRAHAPRPPRRRHHRDLGDADAHAERGGERDPGMARLEAGRHHAVVGQHADDGAGERPAREQAEPARDHREQERLRRDQPPDLARRRPEGAQHRRLTAALGDRERERARHDEQRDGARDPAHRPEDRDEGGAIGRARVAGVGVRRVVAVEDLDAGPRRCSSRARSAVGDTPGAATTPTALTRPGAPDCAAAAAAVKNTAAWPWSRLARPDARPETR